MKWNFIENTTECLTFTLSHKKPPTCSNNTLAIPYTNGNVNGNVNGNTNGNGIHTSLTLHNISEGSGSPNNHVNVNIEVSTALSSSESSSGDHCGDQVAVYSTGGNGSGICTEDEASSIASSSSPARRSIVSLSLSEGTCSSGKEDTLPPLLVNASTLWRTRAISGGFGVGYPKISKSDGDGKEDGRLSVSEVQVVDKWRLLFDLFDPEGFGEILWKDFEERVLNSQVFLREVPIGKVVLLKDLARKHMEKDSRGVITFQFFVGIAEGMLRSHVAWRKANGIGSSLLDWIPPPFLTNTFSVKFLGFEPSSGNPIFFFRFGKWDIRKALEKVESTTLTRYKDQVLEQIMRLMTLYQGWVKRSRGTCKPVTQFIGISDFEGFSLRYFMTKPAIELIVEAAKSFEANYPETLGCAFNLNCPKVFAVLFNLIKPFLSERTLAKIQIYDANATKWIPALHKVVPAWQLPKKYGGMKENGEMWTLSELNIVRNEDPVVGEIVRESMEKKSLKSKSDSSECEGFGSAEFKVIRVSPGAKADVDVDVEKVGMRLSWHIRVEDKDIGLSVLKKWEGNVESHEVVEYSRIEEDISSFICEKKGTYILRLDNTFSRFKAKMVHYKVKVDNPFK